ncbi:MAG: hypothetical protein LBQ60_01040 [Bacteroidales bacterium]|jgi:hypothetical protein|nr:hypothetical protein [Bacteroidales bacterium]
MTLTISSASQNPIDMEVVEWKAKRYSWKITSQDQYGFRIKGLQPGRNYQYSINHISKKIRAENDGSIFIGHNCETPTIFNVKL